VAGTRRRLDRELVRRGLATSGEEARRFIAAGRVTVSGMVADKAARMVLDSDPVVVRAPAGEEFASRGGHKLAGALRDFASSGLTPVDGRICLDAGASTGGFTDVLLRAGAAQVMAVDVGYGQLVWRLQTDERVVVMDRTNVRHLQPADVPAVPSLVVADLSFISLALVLPALTSVVAPAGDLVVMVKPQFEVGREGVGKGGVVTDPAQRAAAVWRICEVAAELGWGANAVTPSQLPGPAGNYEYFLWLRRGEAVVRRDQVTTICDKATTL
jgi:23S rRNA (cytidine1920-2'-O)/16S rRNA (cytidine1409-2'-O)-methyltransferase